MLQLLYNPLLQSCQLPRFFKFKHLKTYDFTYCILPYRAACVPVMSPRCWGTVGHLARSWNRVQLIAQLTSGQCILHAYGSKEDILSSDNMLIQWAVIEELKWCSRFMDCIFQCGWQFIKLSQKLQLCHQGLVEQLLHFQTFVSPVSAKSLLTSSKKYYFLWIIRFCLQQWKNFYRAAWNADAV